MSLGIAAAQYEAAGAAVLAVCVCALTAWWEHTRHCHEANLARQSVIVAAAVVVAFFCHSYKIARNGEAPASPCHATIHGTIVQSTSNGWRSEAVITANSIISNPPVRAPLRVIATAGSPFPPAGTRITLEGTLARPPAARNPGEFDRRQYLRSRGIRAELTVPRHLDQQLTSLPKNADLEQTASKLLLYGNPQSPPAAVVRAMLLGDRSGLTPEQLEIFRNAGVFHLFAVSGLHIGILGMLVTVTARALGAPLKRSLLFAPPAMFLYAVVVGCPPSALRAASMAALGIGIFMMDRRVNFSNLVCIAALLLLLNDSFLLFQPAFQLSFSALLGLVLLGGALYRRIEPTLTPDPFIPKRILTRRQRLASASRQFLAGNICASIGAITATAPFSLHYFNLVTPASIVGNLLLWPLTLAIISCGLATVISSIAHLGILAAPLTAINLTLGNLAEKIASQCARIPGGALSLPHADPALARITVYDLDDAAGCTLIELPSGRRCLIGSGRPNMWTHTISRHLNQSGSRRIDQLVVHHDSLTHNGHVLNAPSSPTPEETYTSSASIKSGHYLPHASPLHAGSTIALDNASLDILFPPSGFSAARQDDRQLIAAFQCEGWRTLVLDSAGFLPTATLLHHAPHTLRADVVIVGWSSLDAPLTATLLHYIAPRAVIIRTPPISVPHQRQRQLTRLLESTGTTTIRLQQHGAATIELDHHHLTITGHITGERWTINRNADASGQSSSPSPSTAFQNQ